MASRKVLPSKRTSYDSTGASTVPAVPSQRAYVLIGAFAIVVWRSFYLVLNIRSWGGGGPYQKYKIGFEGEVKENLGRDYAFVMLSGAAFVLAFLCLRTRLSKRVGSMWRAPTLRGAALELGKGVALLYFIWWYALLSANCWDMTWSKDFISMQVPPQWRLVSRVVASSSSTEQIDAGVAFAETTGLPIVVKNNGCTTQGIGATIAHSAKELREALSEWPDPAGCIIQQYNTDKLEFGVSFEHNPWNGERGIINIAQTFRPCHLKKGWSEKKCDGNECGECDRKPEEVRLDLWTRELEASFVSVADNIPGFRTGRFDVKAKSYDDFKKGHFRVVELNGVMGNVLNHAIHGNNMHYVTRRISFGLGNMWHGRAFPPLHMLRIMLNSVLRAASCQVGELIYCPSSAA